MSNTLFANFACGFVADGSSSDIVIDLSEEPVGYTIAGGTPFVVNPKVATGVTNVLLDDTIPVASASISRGVLTVTFSPAPPVGDRILSGRLLF